MSKIKEKRESIGITQAGLAEKAGLSRATIVNYESGKRSPRELDLHRIADALGCTASDLLGDPPAPRQRRRSRDGGGAKAA